MGERRSRRALVAVVAMWAAAASACGGSAQAPTPRDPDVLIVGSFDFAESEVLAELYAGSLRRHGFEVEVHPAVGPRELLQPALERGLVDLVPEYLGTAIGFFAAADGADVEPGSDVNASFDALAALIEPRGLAALEPAPAQDANAFAVTRATAEAYDLRTLSDLATFAPQMTFGGPPECRDRPLCLPGLERVYDLEFGGFRTLDAGGPITEAALMSSEVDVALVFTTSSFLTRGDLVLLVDDRGLQPAENIVPVVRAEVLARHGADLEAAIQAVSRRLLTAELIRLNRSVVVDGRSPAEVASEWLDANGVGT
jgi:osmoprotectant transport system substrate-binding protein